MAKTATPASSERWAAVRQKIKGTYKVNNAVRQLEAAPAEDNTKKEETANTEKKEPANDTSTTAFSPDMTCTRGQIVTFLKRVIQK